MYPDKTKLIQNILFILFFAGVTINCGGSQINLSGANKAVFSAADENSVDEKTIIIRAGELIKEYRENPAAENKYKGKLMSVSGQISGMLKTPGYAWISVRGEGNFSSSDPDPLGIGCIFAEPDKINSDDLKTSRKVTIVGKNDGMKPAKMMRDGKYVALQNCRIDENASPAGSTDESDSNKSAKVSINAPNPPVNFPDASTGKIPTDEQLQAMLQKTIQDLADAIEKENFTDFKATVSKGAIAYNVLPERLKLFYGHQMMLPRLRKIIGTKPKFSRPPAVATYTLRGADKNSIVFPAINLNGVYEETDSPVQFEVQYLAEGKDWKVSILNFTPAPPKIIGKQFKNH